MLWIMLACAGPGDEKDEPADSDTTQDTDTDDSATTPHTDADGDGFYAEVDDCDDGDARVNPDAEELCNDVDDDCDGSTDGSDARDRVICYPDADGDGYGDDLGFAAARCECDADESLVAGDCDDADAASYPGAAEVACDGGDTNCDGVLPSEDGDGDGFAGCDDCNDADAAVYPGATGACNDCDPSTGLTTADFENDFDYPVVDGITLNGDATVADGVLGLTADGTGSIGTAWIMALANADAPFEARFTVSLCCDGGEGLAFGMIDGNYGETLAGGGGGGLGLAGLGGYGLTFDAHRDADFGDPSDGFLGFVEPTLDPDVLPVLAYADGIDWNDGTPREVVVRWEPTAGGAAELLVEVDGVEALDVPIPRADPTMRLGFTAATGDPWNAVQGVDDVSVAICD